MCSKELIKIHTDENIFLQNNYTEITLQNYNNKIPKRQKFNFERLTKMSKIFF